jgi:transcriptional regulator with XRE-family HTH domain
MKSSENTQAKKSEKFSGLFERIQTLRIKRGITWNQTAALLGVADNSLFFHMKSGRTGISDKIIHRLEEAERESGISALAVREEHAVYSAGATSPASRLTQIEHEQAQISRQLAEYDRLRLRYAHLIEEQLDIMCSQGMTRRLSDDEIAAFRARCAAKAALLRDKNGGCTDSPNNQNKK